GAEVGATRCQLPATSHQLQLRARTPEIRPKAQSPTPMSMHTYSPHHARPPLLLRLLMALITAFILILMTPFVARSEVPRDTLTPLGVHSAAARDSVVRDSTATAALPMLVVALHGEVRSRSELDRAGGGASADA